MSKLSEGCQANGNSRQLTAEMEIFANWAKFETDEAERPKNKHRPALLTNIFKVEVSAKKAKLELRNLVPTSKLFKIF